MDYGNACGSISIPSGPHTLLGQAYRFNAWDLYETNGGLREVLYILSANRSLRREHILWILDRGDERGYIKTNQGRETKVWGPYRRRMSLR